MMYKPKNYVILADGFNRTENGDLDYNRKLEEMDAAKDLYFHSLYHPGRGNLQTG